MPSFVHDGFRLAYEQRGRRQGARERPLGHGESDQPTRARHYRMEFFARQVVALLDHLDVPEAVVAGSSLGANVTLEVAVAAPSRCRAVVVEMPVLERAAPAAALFFVPLAIGYAQTAAFVQRVATFMRRVLRGLGLYPDVFLQLLSRDPVASAAVLHGLLTGRIAPHPDERAKITAPAMVIGHMRDLLHPFSDAEALVRELPDAELIQASSFFELRLVPNRLSDAIADFLDEVWVR